MFDSLSSLLNINYPFASSGLDEYLLKWVCQSYLPEFWLVVTRSSSDRPEVVDWIVSQ